MLKTILGILLFTIAITIIYAWGYVKSQRSSQKLQSKFRNLSESRIVNLLKDKTQIERKKLELAIDGLEVKGGGFSGIRYKVTDPEEMLNFLLKELEKKNILEIDKKAEIIKYRFIK